MSTKTTGGEHLTSCFVVYAAYTGDLPYYVEGARHIDALNAHSSVLIAECCIPCTAEGGHRKRKDSTDVEKTLRRVACGGYCERDGLPGRSLRLRSLSSADVMFNRKYVMSRIERAREAGRSDGPTTA